MDAGAYPGLAGNAGDFLRLRVLRRGKRQGGRLRRGGEQAEDRRLPGPGSPQAAFGVETVIDELCQQLGMDPIEFRLLNAAKEGTRRIEGPVARRIGLVECLEAARDHEHYRAPVEGGNRGRGVAAGFWMNRGFQSSCVVTVNFDGTVSLIMGSVDIGGTRASIAQQTAETLGISYEDVKPTVVDTDSIGYTMVTGGSRTSFSTASRPSRRLSR